MKKKRKKHNYNNPCFTNLYRFVFRFRGDKYPDVVDRLESVESKTGYLRKLVQIDIKYDILNTFKDIENDENK